MTGLILIGQAMAGEAAAEQTTTSDLIAPQAFINHRDPPPWVALPADVAGLYALGHQVFNTSFLPAGTPAAGRRAGLGPLYNGGSCDECHNEGAHGRGPVGDGPVPDSLVIQLQNGTRPAAGPPGDPTYGHVFNTAAVAGLQPEGVARVRYRFIERRYPDGTSLKLREPTYEFTGLRYGPLSPRTVIKPRLAPALFGVGLLELAQTEAGDAQARFGWQSSALSVRDQTARAFSREMGLSNRDYPADDCTPAQIDCVGQTLAETWEVADELLDAVLVFQQWLAVPRSPTPGEPGSAGEKLFSSVGCSGCHRPQLTVKLPAGAVVGASVTDAQIAPYTDLRLHDLGRDLADRDVSGRVQASRWRTAPLWGMGYRLGREHVPTFLHDGRALSAEEAVLWHGGEAAGVRRRFEQLPAAERRQLLEFLGTL